MTRRLTRSRAKANLSAEADLTEENEDEDEDADDENNAIASSLRNLPSSTSGKQLTASHHVKLVLTLFLYLSFGVNFS